MDLTLYVWRQAGPDEKGELQQYDAKEISHDMSFLEMLDVVNDDLIRKDYYWVKNGWRNFRIIYQVLNILLP